MTIEELNEIIIKDENPKLDFKRDYESNKEKSEYLKDIIALANGSVNSIGETAYLIFGIQESQNVNNEIYGIQIDKSSQTIQQDFINRLNSCLVNPIQDLKVQEFEIESKKILVVEIPFQGYLLILKKDLQGTQYKKSNLLYRVGDQTQFVIDSYTCVVRKSFEEAIERYKIVNKDTEKDTLDNSLLDIEDSEITISLGEGTTLNNSIKNIKKSSIKIG